MFTYITRRVLLMFPTLLGVTAVVFFVMAYSPAGLGSNLNQEGAQTQGEEAKRLEQYLRRRYGFDQPRYVQYGRWLNQVSPVGFLMSDQVKENDEVQAEARALLEARPAFAAVPERKQQSRVDLLIDLAAYAGVPIAPAAELILPDQPSPALAPELFRLLDADVEDAYFTKLDALAQTHPDRLQGELLDRVVFESTGRSRVLFSKPRFKWPSLGESQRGRSVANLIGEALPITLLLNVITIPLIYLVSIGTGTLAARYRGSAFDVTSGALFLGLWSIPTMWAGMLLLQYLCSDQNLKLFPTTGLHSLDADAMAFFPGWNEAGKWQAGWLLDAVWHLLLPVFCLTYGGFAFLTKLTRGSVLENLGMDYVRTARAKGVAEHDVLLRHVFRNSLLPLITVFAGILPSLFVGAVIVEYIFSINGMGKLGIEAAKMQDREVVMATTLIGSILALVAQLLRDIAYAIADPRVSYD